MSSTASRGGGRDSGRGRGTRGAQMIVSNGEAAGAGATGGSRRATRMADGRNRPRGSSVGPPMTTVWGMDMETCCREICRILKEEQKVSRSVVWLGCWLIGWPVSFMFGSKNIRILCGG